MVSEQRKKTLNVHPAQAHNTATCLHANFEDPAQLDKINMHQSLGPTPVKSTK